MKTKSIKKGTSKLNDKQFAFLVGHVVNSMRGNVNFPTPVIPLTVVSDKLIRYNRLLELVQGHQATGNQKLEKEELRPSIQKDVDRLFAYVVGSTSNIEIRVSSGFPLAKEATPVGNLPAPVDFSARSTDSGEVTLKSKKLHGADSYIYQYTVSPNPEVDNWVSIPHTSCRLVISNLTSGVKYKFRMCGVGSKGSGQWATSLCYVNF